MVVSSVATTVGPLVCDKPVAGLQVYVEAPLAVKVLLSPTQIEVLDADIVIVGSGFTVTVAVAVFVHPLAPVPVTV